MSKANGQTIGIELRKRREALDLSVEGLAYKAEVSYKTIERIEAGAVDTPRRATVNALRRALDEFALEAA